MLDRYSLPVDEKLLVLMSNISTVSAMPFVCALVSYDGEGHLINVDEVLIEQKGVNFPHVIITEGKSYKAGLLGRTMETPRYVTLYLQDKFHD